MSFPANPTLESGPYGPQPVLDVVGPQGGPYTIDAPLSTAITSQAGRTTSVTTGGFTNNGFRGLYVFFNVTANPGGAQTLELILEMQDPQSGNFFAFLDVPASAAPGGAFLIYPGVSGAAVEGVTLTRNLYLPGTWRARVVHSGAGAWSYSVQGVQLP